MIRSRNAIQCRSHHQKMEKKYDSLDQILESLRLLTENIPNSNNVAPVVVEFPKEPFQTTSMIPDIGSSSPNLEDSDF